MLERETLDQITAKLERQKEIVREWEDALADVNRETIDQQREFMRTGQNPLDADPFFSPGVFSCSNKPPNPHSGSNTRRPDPLKPATG